MAERRLDRATLDVVRKAWSSLLQGYKPDPQTGEPHFTDNEGDTGFLKDVDALNSLLESYMLAPTSFVDPPLPHEQIADHVTSLLASIKIQPEEKAGNNQLYRGFSAAPYPYISAELDYVDSAASVLRLACNTSSIFSLGRKSLPKQLEKLLSGVSCTAADFLFEAAIEDRTGARWPGFVKQIDRPEMYANIFFTNVAVLALYNSLNAPGVKSWIGQDRREKIESLLPKAAAWIAQQYDAAKKGFWIDENKASIQPMGILYALEVLYAIPDSLSDEVRENCASALSNILGQITDLPSASKLQRDFFHTLPLPSGPGITYYDDRRYIGAFLSLLPKAKSADPNVVDNAFIRAGEVLFQGVSDDWIDETADLWDDGRPLICFSQDALIGLVSYAVEGKVDMINLPEFDLRFAVRDTLRTEEVIDAVFSVLIEKIRDRGEQQLRDRISGPQ